MVDVFFLMFLISRSDLYQVVAGIWWQWLYNNYLPSYSKQAKHTRTRCHDHWTEILRTKYMLTGDLLHADGLSTEMLCNLSRKIKKPVRANVLNWIQCMCINHWKDTGAHKFWSDWKSSRNVTAQNERLQPERDFTSKDYKHRVPHISIADIS